MTTPTSPAPGTTPGARARGFFTEQVHAGEQPDAAFGARVAPIHVTAGFELDDLATARARFAGDDDGFVYTRVGNPTTAALERRLAALEGGTDAIVTGSGQAAVSVALLGLLGAGDHLLSSADLYEGSRGLFLENFARFGISVDFVEDPRDPQAWRRLVRPTTRALFAESVSNPTNAVLDIAAVAAVAHEAGVPLVVDNTLATPYLLRPLEHGADVVVHSASKFLAGHGSALGGVIVTDARSAQDGGCGVDWAARSEGAPRFPHLVEPSRAHAGRSWVDVHGPRAYVEHTRSVVASRLGPVLSPFNAFLVQQGVETLGLRVARHSASAAEVARWLDRRPEVVRVDHAVLPTHPSHELAGRYLPRGAGSVFSLTLAGGLDAAEAFIDALELFSHMTHLGDVRSLVVHPASTTHAQRTPAERERAGIRAGTVRLSIGIEDVEDLVADLERGLDAARRAVAAPAAAGNVVVLPVARTAPRRTADASPTTSAAGGEW